MKTPKLKMMFHLLISVVVSFVCIYLAVFFGGWKLIESGDPILLEIAVSIIVGFIFWIIFELSKFYEEKLKELEERVKTLENQNRIP
ncbi:MAG: hypothetical protein J6B86_03755 [Clostridia bacterium]|nr:hypothetical protein [Clostridia bacterium]